MIGLRPFFSITIAFGAVCSYLEQLTTFCTSTSVTVNTLKARRYRVESRHIRSRSHHSMGSTFLQYFILQRSSSCVSSCLLSLGHEITSYFPLLCNQYVSWHVCIVYSSRIHRLVRRNQTVHTKTVHTRNKKKDIFGGRINQMQSLSKKTPQYKRR